MNSFLDVTANQRSALNAHKNYSDLKQLSPKLAHTPLAQQSNNTNHTKTQANQNGSNQSKNGNRRKSSTYQTNGKKRNFSGSQHPNVGVSNSVDNRQYQRLGNNNSLNHNATVSGKKGDKHQTKDNFDSTRPTNTTSSLSSDYSEGSTETHSSKSSKGNWNISIAELHQYNSSLNTRKS